MAKFDFKKLVNDSADKLKTGAQKAQEAAKGFDIKTAAGDVVTKGKDAAEYFKQKTDETVQAVSQAVRKKEEVRGLITAQGAVKLMCMMMAADGDISQQELGQLQEIGKELDEHFPEYQGKVVEECTALVEKLDAENYREELNDVVRDVIQESLHASGATVPVKLLLWNLLVVAQSDSCYQEEEAKLIRYIARHLEIDKSIVPEMEHALRAMLAIENEMKWLKSTDRPFGTVEPVLTELAKRKATIVQAIHDLIGD